MATDKRNDGPDATPLFTGDQLSTDPFARRTLKAVALATNEPVGWRMRSKFRHGIEHSISVFAQVTSVSVAQVSDMGTEHIPIVRLARVWLQGVGRMNRQHTLHEWRKIFAGNVACLQGRDVISKARLQFG
jgi:hypothetical protein